MDLFTQNKTLIRAVVALVIVNVCSIGLFLWKDAARDQQSARPMRDDNKSDKTRGVGRDEDNRPATGEGRKDLAQVLARELTLTQQQVEQISNIRESFFVQERVLEAYIRSKRDSMNGEMFNENTNEPRLQYLAREVSDGEYKMELLRIGQAKQLKAILTPQQQNRLHTLVRDIRDYFKPEDKAPKTPPPRE